MLTSTRMMVTACAFAAAAVATAQTTDFAENNASQWGVFASDNAAASVANSTEHLKDGSGAILFTTNSGFDTGVKYPATATLNLNAAVYNTLVFWEYPENTTPIGWQDNQPIVVIRTATGTIRLAPDSQITPNFAWRLFKAPLAGGNGWTRTTTGTPNLASVRQIEIHHDTWDYGFRIWFDGVRFMNLDPNELPPPGPPPPPGVDPDAIHSKVLLYVLDPIMENFGGLRMHEVYGWQDPVALTDQVRQDFLTSSHGRAVFDIVETVLADEYPIFQDGFQHNDETFASDWDNRVFHNSTFDYVRFCDERGIGERVDAGEIDELWLYAPPIGGMWESCMAGRGAYWINGPTYPDAGREKAFVIMGWNFERGVGEAIHSFGHRAEGTMVHSYGSWEPNRGNTWSRFALLDRDAPGLGGVGNVHFPVNGESDYDYANERLVSSNADAWLAYPNLNENTRVFNFREWSPLNADSQREYLNWWYSHMPHVPGRAPDYFLGNWWRYLLDVDQFKNWNGNLFLTIGQPTVRITSPGVGEVVAGPVTVRASAEVDGALGRVDFYVDGRYASSDFIAPYTFAWSPCDAPGVHTLAAKAYELQNGTEGLSTAVAVEVACPPCPADFNQDGGVDGSDVEAFFAAWEAGGTDADVNQDGGVDGGDVAAFFVAWEAGGCG
ncbi:MAG: hypothetical protein JSR77_00325 [Planctomycetes bacterium]|nr:hypothetical protein [Planctomycetota bacterium]